MKLKYIILFLFLTPLLLAETGKITFLNGTVDVQKKGNWYWEAAKINKNVSNGDKIRTRLQSRAEVLLPDNSFLKIEENTVFQVKIVDSEKENEYSFFPLTREVSADFEKLLTSRQIKTIESPNDVATVKGTEFTTGVNQGKRTFVRVRKGNVEDKSKSAGNFVIVSSNQLSDIKPGEDPPPPQDTLGEYPSLINAVQEEPKAAIRFELKINMNKFVFTEPLILTQGLKIQGISNPGAQVSAGSAVALADATGNFQLIVSVREGLNTISINSQLGKQAKTAELRVFINSAPPRLTLKKPENSRFISRPRYELEGAIDDQTPMDQVDLFVDQRFVGKFSAKSNFRIPVILKEGLNELTITSRDRSGNVVKETESLFLDTIKPQIVILQPAASGKIIDLPPNPPTGRQRPETFIVSGRVLDPQPSSGLKKVSINNVSVQLSPNGQFELPLKLKDGVNELIFIALDRAGNEQQVSRGIIVHRGS